MSTPEYPVQILFNDGDRWVLDNEDELATSLEWFDSEDPDEEATALDARGRRVHIVVEKQDLLVFRLAEPPSAPP